MNFGKKIKQDSLGFPFAPMLDVVFLLLCFFVTTQIFSQWETEIDISLPTSKTGEVPQRLPGEIIVNIVVDGSTLINGREVDNESLNTMLKELAELFPGQPIILRADKKTDYEHVVRVLDSCRQADIWNISFATNVPEE